MDQQPSNPQTPIEGAPQTPAQPPVVPNKNKRYLMLGAGVVVVAIVIGIVVGLSSHGKKTEDAQKATAPTLTVGSHPYLYACNALTRDDIKKAGATLRDDKGGEAVSAIQAIPYDQTPGGRYDLAKTTEDPLLSGAVTSNCDYLLSDFTSFDQKHVKITVNQYPDADQAQKIFKTRQDNKKGTPFPSYKNTSWVESESSSSKNSDITAAFLLDNRVVELKYSVGNVTPDTAATKLDSLATTIVKNLSNTATATKPYNFSNLGSIGTTKLADACHALNFKKADAILGDLHYEQTNVDNDYKYGKTSANSPGISAQCSVHFRYAADDAKQPDYRTQSFTDAETRFPNELVLSIASYPSQTEATSAVEGLKKSKTTAVDFSYGATSFAYTQTDSTLGYPTTAHHFLTVHGGSVISVSVSEGTVQKPYVSTVKNVTTAQAKQLLDSLNL